MKFFTSACPRYSRNRAWRISFQLVSSSLNRQGCRSYAPLKTFAYLFERFPAFTQTFCAREVAELHRQGLKIPVFSIRRPTDPRPINIALDHVPITYLPDTNSLRFKLRTKLVSPKLRSLWRQNDDLRDKNRYYEAIYLGASLRAQGVGHLHVHFAALAARTAWWIRRLFGITYSVTGHANDIFCAKSDERVPLEQLIRDARFVVAVSDYGSAFLSKLVPLAAGKIHRIYNGLDLSRFKEARTGTEPVKLVTIGRLIEKKGFRQLIEACALLAKEQTHRFTLRIVGAGPLQSELQRVIEHHQLSETVSLAGEKTQAEIVDELASAQIFVLPCIHDQQGDSDNLPTVIVEAMAAALPIISTRVAGIPELVANGENGLLVPEKDIPALASAIRQLIREPTLRQLYGTASRQRAQGDFRIEHTVAALGGLFADYLA